MTALNFVYWLQGMLELSKAQSLDASQVKMIKDHIKLVLNKVTPEEDEPVCGIPFCSMRGSC